MNLRGPRDEAVGRAREAIKRWGLLSALEGNLGWDYLKQEMLAEAQDLWGQIHGVEESLAAGTVQRDEAMLTIYFKQARWYALMALVNRVRDVKAESKEATRLLESVKAQEKE